MKKILVIGIIFLFIGIAIAPGINANNSLIKNKMQLNPEKESVNFTVEACGLNGEKKTVELTKKEVEKVEKLFNSIRERLNETKTREEAEEVFREAVIELDKYSLLGDLSIKQAQKLVTNRNWDSKLFEKISNRHKNNSENKTNYYCAIVGRTESTYCYHRLNPWIEIFYWYLSDNFFAPLEGFFFNKNRLFLTFLTLGVDILTLITSAITKGLGWGISNFSPLSLFNLFCIGYYDTISEEFFYAPGWIWSIGNLGVVNWNGMLLGNLPSIKIDLVGWLFEIGYPAVWGFNGIKITLNFCNHEKFYLGTAFAVGLDEKNEV